MGLGPNGFLESGMVDGEVRVGGRGGNWGTNSTFSGEPGGEYAPAPAPTGCAGAVTGGPAAAFSDGCLAGAGGRAEVGDSAGDRLLLLRPLVSSLGTLAERGRGFRGITLLALSLLDRGDTASSGRRRGAARTSSVGRSRWT
jgi:hypothetical protein